MKNKWDVILYMLKFKCTKCNKEFNKKANLDRHYARTNPCDSKHLLSKNTLTCPECNKQFSTYRGYSKHIKDSICAKKDINDNLTVNNTTNIDTQINGNVTNNLSANNLNIDNSVNNNLKVDGDVKLVNFGNENLSYISDDLFKSILGRGMKAVEELIDHVHFNADHPENHNLYVANIQKDYIIAYDGDTWTIYKEDEFFEDIIYAKSDFLCVKFKELIECMNPIDVAKFQNFINHRDEDQTMNTLKRNLKLQFYNNRHYAIVARNNMKQESKQKTISNRKIKKRKLKTDELIDYVNHDMTTEEREKLIKALQNSA